jgi:hypothetical protein
LPDWRWDGNPGHYEVFYITTTDPQTGTGLWIRHTMLAPDDGEPTQSAWFMATFPDRPPIARKHTAPQIDAECTPTSMRGSIDDVAWDLRWEPGQKYEHVHPLLQKAKIAKTILELPNADVAVHGTVTLPGGETLTLDGPHGGQAHLWGSKHSLRWTWAHCGDFTDADGTPQPGTFIDGVSVIVPRFGREVGPSSPLVGRILGEDFLATAPLSVLRAPSRFALTSWSFEVTAGKRRLVGEVDAPRESLVGVTYTDPDGDKAYCYNSEVASMRLSVFDKAKGRWDLRQTLLSHGRAHFEYGQREPVPGLELHLT